MVKGGSCLLVLSSVRFLSRESCISAASEEVNVFLVALLILISILTSHSSTLEYMRLRRDSNPKMVGERKKARNSRFKRKVQIWIPENVFFFHDFIRIGERANLWYNIRLLCQRRRRTIFFRRNFPKTSKMTCLQYQHLFVFRLGSKTSLSKSFCVLWLPENRESFKILENQSNVWIVYVSHAYKDNYEIIWLILWQSDTYK